MAAVTELILVEESGALSFGNHTLEAKAKVEDFGYAGDVFKVKTYKTMTKLEKNGMFVYESVPGTSVNHFKETENGVSFVVEGTEDAQLTIGLEDMAEYQVFINEANVGTMKTHVGGKLSVSVELAGAGEVKVEIRK